jgi:hypothetical protein
MRVQLTIPDETAELYKSYCRSNQPLEEILVIQLERFSQANPKERWLLLPPLERGQIEKIIGVPISTPPMLVKRIMDLGSVKLGAIQLRFSIGQLREIRRRALSFRKTPQEYTAEVIASILERFHDLPGFTKGPFVAEADALLAADAGAAPAPLAKD